MWSHDSFFIQCPVQRSLQPSPKYPGGQSLPGTQKKHRVIVIPKYSSEQAMIAIQLIVTSPFPKYPVEILV